MIGKIYLLSILVRVQYSCSWFNTSIFCSTGEQSTSGEGIGDLVSREDSTKAAGSDEEFKLETDTSEDGYSDVQEGTVEVHVTLSMFIIKYMLIFI